MSGLASGEPADAVTVLVNGQPSGAARSLADGQPSDSVSALDRALHFGEGLFETIACLNGRPRFLSLHLERLEFGCERLRIQPPAAEEVAEDIHKLVNGVDHAIVKLLVTGGDAVARGYARTGTERATRITIRYPWQHEDPSQLHDGVMTRTLSLRLGENPRLAGLKHCNRLEQILARAELADHSQQSAASQTGGGPPLVEGILFSSSGNLVSGTMTNIFLVRESCLLTPRIDHCGVAGVMRRVVLREARRVGIPTRECELRAENLVAADEVFLTNARIGIWPVRSLDDRNLTPGPVTRHLQSVLQPLLSGAADTRSGAADA